MSAPLLSPYRVAAGIPALVLAPMDGITDAPMRAIQGECGAFSYAVTEFIRVSGNVLPPKTFRAEVPELSTQCLTAGHRHKVHVQIQILGGDAGRMAESAYNAYVAGATSLDINFGCPAPTVNRNDGGATLLQYPTRIKEIVRAVRDAFPSHLPVSAKLRLGWESIEDIHVNAAMAEEGGATWLTIHARTRAQRYQPPVFWPHIGAVKQRAGIPIVANGDIWNLDNFHQCQDETGCEHFMIGRSALARPLLPNQIAASLGLLPSAPESIDWEELLHRFVALSEAHYGKSNHRTLFRLKQWMKIASLYGNFGGFESIKKANNLDEFFAIFGDVNNVKQPVLLAE